MEYIDVIFPLKLGRLTYSVPEGMVVSPGAMVECEVRKSLVRGIVLGPAAARPKGAIKPVAAVVEGGPVLGGALLRLMLWMAEYYMAPEGIVLKSIYPEEFFKKVKARKGKGILPVVAEPKVAFGPDEAAALALEGIRAHAAARHYKTYLYHAPSRAREEAFALEAVRGLSGGAILLAPDIARVDRLYDAARAEIGDRAVLYRSGMSGGARSEALTRMASAQGCVVVGSRSAVFAPIADMSLIAVLGEESRAYKEEGGVLYGGRDVAVMRAYLESAAALLSSPCPSAESLYNVRLGKYLPVASGSGPGPGRPAVRVIDMRVIDMRAIDMRVRDTRRTGRERAKAAGAGQPQAGQPKDKPAISAKVRAAAERAIGRGERALFVVNRPGYSMLRCGDCGEMPMCPRCAVPLLFFKQERVLRCAYCGHSGPPPDACPGCGGPGMGPAGAGLERVTEELAALGLRPQGGEGGDKEGPLSCNERIVAGMRGDARRGAAGEVAMAAILNADAYLHTPDFRAQERAFQDIVYIADSIRPGGELFLQTRHPEADLIRYVRRLDYARFVRREIEGRRALGYPPLRRLALLTVEGKDIPGVAPISAIATIRMGPGAEVLGPAPATTKRGRAVHKVLVKADSPQMLRRAVRTLMARLAGRKVVIDIDPVSV